MPLPVRGSVKPPRPAARSCAGSPLLCAALLLCAASPLAAQVTGRWAMLVGGGLRGMTRGELRLGGPRSTLWLESDSAPVPLAGLVTTGDTAVTFHLPDAGGLVFTGFLKSDVLRGTARADTGVPRIWTATRLQEMTEYYPVLPRFTLRQIVSGRADSVERLPGPWVAAARAAPDSLSERYAALARAAGLPALSGDALRHESALRALGLARRDELVRAVQATLTAIARQIPDVATRSAFDRIFRPRGTWLVDVHDAALAFARAGSPAIRLADAEPALRAVGWLSPGAHDDVRISAALYRLHGLLATDSTMVSSLLDAMRRANPSSAASVEMLLRAYDAAYTWHSVALRFLLSAPWIGSGGPRSLAERMRRSWGDSLPLPAVASRYFGYPQAVPRYGVPPAFFQRILRPDNWSANRWLERHHPAALLATLRLLATDFAPDAEVASGTETFRLTTVREEAESRDNGFLEPEDAIVVDGGYVPLLALAAALHEWEHLAFESRRRQAGDNDPAGIVMLRASDAYVAEGVAEWRTERLLEPLATAFPLLLAGEAEKHARLAATADDPHVLGLRMVRSLAAALPADSARLAVLLDAADEPASVLRHPEVAGAWARYRNAPDLMTPGPGRRALIPELTFTVEDGYPDLVSMRISTP